MVWSGAIDPSWSYPDIIRLAGMSRIPFGISSTYRPGSMANGHLDYHSQGMAVDFTSTTAGMNQLAAWFQQLSPYLLEEIHTSDSSPGGGFFVKNGKDEPSSFYRSDLSGHYDHVHIAATKQGVAAAIQHLGGGSGSAIVVGGTGLGPNVAPNVDPRVASSAAYQIGQAIGLDKVQGAIGKLTAFANLPNLGVRFVAGFFGVTLFTIGLFMFAVGSGKK